MDFELMITSFPKLINATYITLLGENGSGSRDHVTHNDIWQSRSSARIQFTVSYVTTS